MINLIAQIKQSWKLTNFSLPQMSRKTDLKFL